MTTGGRKNKIATRQEKLEYNPTTAASSRCEVVWVPLRSPEVVGGARARRHGRPQSSTRAAMGGRGAPPSTPVLTWPRERAWLLRSPLAARERRREGPAVAAEMVETGKSTVSVRNVVPTLTSNKRQGLSLNGRC
jgi:hypothetical protein